MFFDFFSSFLFSFYGFIGFGLLFELIWLHSTSKESLKYLCFDGECDSIYLFQRSKFSVFSTFLASFF